MVETSYFWDGLVTGDAALSPYTHDLWHRLWQIMFSRADNEGVLNDVDDELAVSGTAIAVSVASGKALVDGSLYENNAPVSVAIPTPVTDPRIDRIVVQKDWSTQTIRVARVPGTENASPTAPALTQTDLSIWETPLAQALITTGGVITVTDERENARTRLALAGAGITAIETIVATGSEGTLDFQGIPSTFKHLEIHGSLLTNISISASAEIRLNGDSAAANYNRIVFGAVSGVAVAQSTAGMVPPIDTLGDHASNDELNTQIDIRIPNYKDTTFYKTITQKESVPENAGGGQSLSIETAIWLNADAVGRISIVASNGSTFVAGSTLTLFGID